MREEQERAWMGHPGGVGWVGHPPRWRRWLRRGEWLRRPL